MEEKTEGISRQLLGNLRNKFDVMKGVINIAAFGCTEKNFNLRVFTGRNYS